MCLRIWGLINPENSNNNDKVFVKLNKKIF